jgi:two-component system, chemotaxis family, protein-glutamate methylesterase/glutaminase
MTRCELVIIGASWGGLAAVGEVLRGLPADFELPILVVQHRSESADDVLADLLDRAGPLPVREVEDKQPLEPGAVFVAPPGYHVLVEADHLALSTEAQVHFSRPSIDVALETAADAIGAGVVGVVLTGNNDDGAAGLAAVRRRGGYAIVQDPDTALRPTMPAAARAAADPQAVAPLEEIAPLLVRLARAGEVVADA